MTVKPAFADRNAGARHIYSIDAGRSFAQELATGVDAMLDAASDPGVLADTVIFAPTRRATRAIASAFARVAESRRQGPSILPRIKALGDVDEDEIMLFSDAEYFSDTDLSLPPAISATERLVTLARLAAARNKAFSGDHNWPAALSAGRELGKLLDSLYTEEIAPHALKSAAPDELAGHWEQSLEFLKIVTEAWPDHLETTGRMDPAERRAKLIRLQADRFLSEKPQSPVFVAGTTGSSPSVAYLLEAVLSLPRGAVILPGLDRPLTRDHAWREIEDPHPQAGLKALLERLAIDPDDVRPWPAPRHTGANATKREQRRALISLALRPAEATDDWLSLVNAAQEADPTLTNATDGLAIATLDDEDQEAAAIAIKMRETVERREATAMLVTPDRDLSRRVAQKLRRWDIVVDDSAGVPFSNTPCGVFLRLVADWIAAPADPVALLALCDHGLARFGLSPEDKTRAHKALDQGLRGLRPPGAAINAVRAALETPLNRRQKKPPSAVIEPILQRLEAACASWDSAVAEGFSGWLKAHIAAAEIIAGTDDIEGAQRLWRFDDGEAGAALVSELLVSGAAIEAARSEYPAVFAMLISGVAVRRRAAAHPRLSILGPLEARLQSAEVVILGGLNEGVWPADAPSDPFLSRAMRRAVGLPSPERRVGLAAHDFAQLASQPQTLLTRSKRAGGKPSKPSRWLVRLQNIIAGAEAQTQTDASCYFDTLASALDQPASVKRAEAPNFAPPVRARPRHLFVTAIGDLLRDPYTIFAKQILGLRKLDDPGVAFEQRHLGELFHSVFETFAADYPVALPENPLEELRARFAKTAERYAFSGPERAFWSETIDDTLTWFAGFHAERQQIGKPLVLEGKGAHTLLIDGDPFEISAFADRIDRRNDGGLDIFDYKSRSLPTHKQAAAGFQPQLPLTGLIAAHGGFDGDDASGDAPVNSFHYLRFLERRVAAKENISGATGADAARAIEEARIGLEAIIRYYDNPDTAYLSQPRPKFEHQYGDYDHLARRRERQAGGDEDEAGTS